MTVASVSHLPLAVPSLSHESREERGKHTCFHVSESVASVLALTLLPVFYPRRSAYMRSYIPPNYSKEYRWRWLLSGKRLCAKVEHRAAQEGT